MLRCAIVNQQLLMLELNVAKMHNIIIHLFFCACKGCLFVVFKNVRFCVQKS